MYIPQLSMQFPRNMAFHNLSTDFPRTFRILPPDGPHHGLSHQMISGVMTSLLGQTGL